MVDGKDALDGDVQIEIEGVTVGVDAADNHAGLLHGGKWEAVAGVGERGNRPVLPGKRKVSPGEDAVGSIPRHRNERRNDLQRN